MDSIGAFLQANVKYSVFVKLEIRYGEYLLEYANYFGIPLRLNNSMYEMTNYGKLFDEELTIFFIDKAGFKKSLCQISI